MLHSAVVFLNTVKAIAEWRVVSLKLIMKIKLYLEMLVFLISECRRSIGFKRKYSFCEWKAIWRSAYDVQMLEDESFFWIRKREIFFTVIQRRVASIYLIVILIKEIY